MKKSIQAILSVVLMLILGATVFTACGSKHEHGFSEAWTHDEAGHWHACTGEDCGEKSEFAAHTYDNDADTTCNVCGYERPEHTHTAAMTWNKDDMQHWHECTIDGCTEKLYKAEHAWNAGEITTPASFTSDGEKRYTCTVCEKTKTETVAMEYIDVNYVESDAEVQTKVRFIVAEAGTYYFRYEVKNCGFANGYYWINMNKVGGGLQQTDTTHAQAKIYDANKQLIKTGMYTRAAGQFGAVETSSDTPEIVRKLLENGVKYLEMPFVTPGEYEMIVTHYPSNSYKTLEYSEGTFSKTNVALWNGSYNYFKLTLTEEMLEGGYYGTDLQLGASPATGLTWQFLDANGNPVEKQEGDSDTYYSEPAAGTYYIVIYTATKQTGVTVSASIV